MKGIEGGCARGFDEKEVPTCISLEERRGRGEQQRRIKLKIKEGEKKIRKDDRFFKYKSAVAKEKRYF